MSSCDRARGEALPTAAPIALAAGGARLRKAILPVAGLGTRLLPATKSIPKEMLPLVDRPLIHYALEEARAAGVEEFIFVTGPGKSAIEDYFEPAPAIERALRESGRADLIAALRTGDLAPGAAVFIRQTDEGGLGDAIRGARRLIGDEPFAVILPCDLVVAATPCLAQMAAAHRHVGGALVAIEPATDASRGDRPLVERNVTGGRMAPIRGFAGREDPGSAQVGLATIGRFILPPSVFDSLDRLARAAGGPVGLSEAINEEIRGGRAVHGLRFAGRRFDCGSTVGLLQATVALALERAEMAAALAEFFDHGGARASAAV